MELDYLAVGTAHSLVGGSGGMLPQKNFGNLDSLRAILTHFWPIFVFKNFHYGDNNIVSKNWFRVDVYIRV